MPHKRARKCAKRTQIERFLPRSIALSILGHPYVTRKISRKSQKSPPRNASRPAKRPPRNPPPYQIVKELPQKYAKTRAKRTEIGRFLPRSIALSILGHPHFIWKKNQKSQKSPPRIASRPAKRPSRNPPP